MTANVETMFYMRKKPWHGLDVEIQGALNNADMLKMAGLDWEVKQRDIQVRGGVKIENYRTNVRSTDGCVFGVTSDRYQIAQNRDTFSSTDELIDDDVRCETTGSLQSDKKIWLLARMPKYEVVGDKVGPCLCLLNTHNGSGSIHVCIIPTHIVCSSTLNLALNSVKRQWATEHVSNIDERMQGARICLQPANAHMDELAVYVGRLANTTITNEQLDKLLDEMFPAGDNDIERKKNSVKKAKDEFMICYLRPDIIKFLNTDWGVVDIMSDMTSHSTPRRQTGSYRENNWNRIIGGHKILDHITEFVCAQ